MQVRKQQLELLPHLSYLLPPLFYCWFPPECFWSELLHYSLYWSACEIIPGVMTKWEKDSGPKQGAGTFPQLPGWEISCFRAEVPPHNHSWVFSQGRQQCPQLDADSTETWVASHLTRVLEAPPFFWVSPKLHLSVVTSRCKLEMMWPFLLLQPPQWMCMSPVSWDPIITSDPFIFF